MPKNVTTLFSDRHNIRYSLHRADLLIGAILIPGAKAPRLVRREDLREMQPRCLGPGDEDGADEPTCPGPSAGPAPTRWTT
jgi:alanine dehydrogenase